MSEAKTTAPPQFLIVERGGASYGAASLASARKRVRLMRKARTTKNRIDVYQLVSPEELS